MIRAQGTLNSENREIIVNKMNTYSSVWIKIRLWIHTLEINCNNSYMQILTSNFPCTKPATFTETIVCSSKKMKTTIYWLETLKNKLFLAAASFLCQGSRHDCRIEYRLSPHHNHRKPILQQTHVIFISRYIYIHLYLYVNI